MKHRGLATGLLILVSGLSGGCDLLGASEGFLGARFELEGSSYQAGETIRARFINDSRGPVYRVRVDCHDAGIEQRSGETWIRLERDVICTADVVYTLIPKEKEVTIALPFTLFAAITQSPVGEFRLVWNVARKPDYRDAQDVRSAVFQIVSE